MYGNHQIPSLLVEQHLPYTLQTDPTTQCTPLYSVQYSGKQYCTLLYSVQYNSKQYRGYKLGNILVGQLWLIISGHEMEKFQFHYSVAYSALMEFKNWE